MGLTPQKAELIGAHAGDGTLYQTWKNTFVWELRGALEEKEYYLNNICPLLKDIFRLEIISKFRSGGAHGVWGVQTTKKEIIHFFLEWGFNPGSKTYSVTVPEYIFSSSALIKRAFVRGLFDTDGCLRFDRINKTVNREYPRIEFGFASIALRDSLKKLLGELGFNSFIWNDKSNYRLCVPGKNNLEKWINEIEPKNPKHLKKYYIWKEKGCY
ncbi:MAG: LAGLIDADG family homing endonuclease [Candidatus Woesearchaeota archaeon]